MFLLAIARYCMIPVVAVEISTTDMELPSKKHMGPNKMHQVGKKELPE
jgi:hypothetical protein